MDAEEAIIRTSETLGVVVHFRYRNKNSAKVVTSAQLYCKHGRTPSTTHGNSGKTDCPFVLQYKWDPNDSSYVIEPINTVHNHPIVVRTTGVTGLPEALKWRIREMRQQEASSSTIMEMLRQEGQPILSYSDIASIGRRPQDLRVFLDEFTLFFNELNSRNFLYEFDEPVGKDDRRYIKHVFFTTHEALDTFKHFPEVVLFDTTYKTNVSRKPLGAFVGIDANHKSFVIGMVLLSSEKTDAFNFAMEALLKKSNIDKNLVRTVFTDYDKTLRLAFSNHFPDASLLICRWHVKKNVLASIFAKYDLDEEGKSIVEMDFDVLASYTKSIEEFEERACNFLERYAEASETIQRWINRKKGWAEAYTLRCVRLGATSTQRVESNNSALKGQLHVASHLNRFVEKEDGMMRVGPTSGSLIKLKILSTFRSRVLPDYKMYLVLLRDMLGIF